MAQGIGYKTDSQTLGQAVFKGSGSHLSPGERNPIEGKFGQAKTAYGLDNIKAKLKQTSESWIASIALVLNLVNLTRQALVRLLCYNYFCFVQLFYKAIQRKFYIQLIG